MHRCRRRCQTRGGPGGRDELHYDLVREQGFATPVLSNEGEHPVLDAVPLAGARRMVNDGVGQAGLVGELLELELPEPDAGAVGAAAVGGDQQTLGPGLTLAAHTLPPAADALDGEAGGETLARRWGPCSNCSGTSDECNAPQKRGTSRSPACCQFDRVAQLESIEPSLAEHPSWRRLGRRRGCRSLASIGSRAPDWIR